MAYVTGREHEGAFWGAGNILFYDLGVGYIGVKFVKFGIYIYDTCSLLYVYHILKVKNKNLHQPQLQQLKLLSPKLFNDL